MFDDLDCDLNESRMFVSFSLACFLILTTSLTDPLSNCSTSTACHSKGRWLAERRVNPIDDWSYG